MGLTLPLSLPLRHSCVGRNPCMSGVFRLGIGTVGRMGCTIPRTSGGSVGWTPACARETGVLVGFRVWDWLWRFRSPTAIPARALTVWDKFHPRSSCSAWECIGVGHYDMTEPSEIQPKPRNHANSIHGIKDLYAFPGRAREREEGFGWNVRILELREGRLGGPPHSRGRRGFGGF